MNSGNLNGRDLEVGLINNLFAYAVFIAKFSKHGDEVSSIQYEVIGNSRDFAADSASHLRHVEFRGT